MAQAMMDHRRRPDAFRPGTPPSPEPFGDVDVLAWDIQQTGPDEVVVTPCNDHGTGPGAPDYFAPLSAAWTAEDGATLIRCMGTPFVPGIDMETDFSLELDHVKEYKKWGQTFPNNDPDGMRKLYRSWILRQRDDPFAKIYGGGCSLLDLRVERITPFQRVFRIIFPTGEVVENLNGDRGLISGLVYGPRAQRCSPPKTPPLRVKKWVEKYCVETGVDAVTACEVLRLHGIANAKKPPVIYQMPNAHQWYGVFEPGTTNLLCADEASSLYAFESVEEAYMAYDRVVLLNI